MEVEICANSYTSALNALKGGAKRIELCRQLDVGGLTPAWDDIRACLQLPGLRTHVLIRPCDGGFHYSDEDYERICHDVEQCRSFGVPSVVVGFLTADGTIDEPRTRHIVQLAAPMQVTFHRAFDATPNRASPPSVHSNPQPLAASSSSPVQASLPPTPFASSSKQASPKSTAPANTPCPTAQ